MINSQRTPHLVRGEVRRRRRRRRRLPSSSRWTSRTASGCVSDRPWLTTTIWLIGTTLCFANQAFSSAATSANSGFKSGCSDLLAEHRVEFAVDQHLHDLLAGRRPLGRVPEFGDMGVLERHPVDRIEIDAIVIGEDAAQPCAGRGGEGADADALAVEVARRFSVPCLAL